MSFEYDYPGRSFALGTMVHRDPQKITYHGKNATTGSNDFGRQVGTVRHADRPCRICVNGFGDEHAGCAGDATDA